MSVLFNGIRGQILSLLFLNEKDKFHVRDIARRINKSAMGVSVELRKLEEVGVVTSQKNGNMVFYQANQDFIGAKEIKKLLQSSIGVADIISSTLENFSGIKEAFIYGSFAKGSFDFSSDIDLFVLGRIKYAELMENIYDLEDSLGREINIQVMTEKEYTDRKAKNDPYILDIEKNKRIYLIHDKEFRHEFGKKTTGKFSADRKNLPKSK